MHKRHGEMVTQVLEQKVAENAAKLVDGTLDSTSLLALALGQERLRQQHQVPPEARGNQSASRSRAFESVYLAQSQDVALARVENALAIILAKLGASAPGTKTKSKRKPLTKRETVIFAAILMELKGLKYCSFLHDHGIKPRWSEPGPSTYQQGYKVGDPWRKKVQDEKTRAKPRMSRYANSELANAFNTYLPDKFTALSALLPAREPRMTPTKSRVGGRK
jgi:hypothetical protein